MSCIRNAGPSRWEILYFSELSFKAISRIVRHRPERANSNARSNGVFLDSINVYLGVHARGGNRPVGYASQLGAEGGTDCQADDPYNSRGDHLLPLVPRRKQASLAFRKRLALGQCRPVLRQINPQLAGSGQSDHSSFETAIFNLGPKRGEILLVHDTPHQCVYK